VCLSTQKLTTVLAEKLTTLGGVLVGRSGALVGGCSPKSWPPAC